MGVLIPGRWYPSRPDFGDMKGSYGVVLHATESGGGSTLAMAKRVADWQRNNPERGSLYHWLIASDGSLRTCRPRRAAGGLSTSRDPSVWAPKGWLDDLLPDKVMRDPNAYFHHIAFVGRVTDFERYGFPASMPVRAARIIRWLERQWWGRDNQVVSAHSDWQLDRYDPGRRIFLATMAEF